MESFSGNGRDGAGYGGKFRSPDDVAQNPEDEFLWAPSIEMYEKQNDYIIRMEIPGVNPADVDISLSGDTLTVKGERKPSENVQDESYQLCEMCYGSFTRSISLPEPVNADKIEATFNNGILDLRIPKASEVKPKQIKIRNAPARAALSQSKSDSGTRRDETEGTESVADASGGVSPSEQKAKSKIPYEG